MKGSTKWIFVYLVIALCLILSTHSQPTKEGLLVKRVEKSDVNELHQATLTRSESSTATTKGSTPTATSTHPGNGNGSDNGSMPAIIQAENAGWWIAVYGTESGISSKMAALGAILIFLGVFLCLAGFRMSKVMLCAMGLLTFGSMTWIALANCRPEQGYSRDTITMIVVPVGVGVAGAIAYYFVWNIAIYLVGAFGGFIFAVFICSWRSDLVIVNLIGRSCFLGGMALAAAIVTRFALRISFLFTTSFVGAYIMMFGVDCLARTGFIAGPQALLNRNPNHQVEYVLYKNVYVLLAMVIAIYLMSFAWQFVFNAAYQLGLHIVAAVEGKKAHEEFHHRDAGGEEEAAAGGGGGDPPASAPAHAASAHT